MGDGQVGEPKMILLLSFFRKNNKKIFFSFSMGWKLSTKNSSSPSLRGGSLFHKNFLLLPVKKKGRKIPIRSLLSLGHSVPTIRNRSLTSLGHSVPTIRTQSLLSLGHSVPTICNRSLLSLGHSVLRSAIGSYYRIFGWISFSLS